MKNKIHILLVDDDRVFTPLIQEYLTAKDLQVEMKHSGEEGLSAFIAGTFDLCILDVKMPMKDGFVLAREIRELDPKIPFIFLSGQQEKDYRIKGFNLGADDYVTKPFSMEELYLRIMAILRRVGQQEQVSYEKPRMLPVGTYSFNPFTRELTRNGEVQKMTHTEARLLEMFLESETLTIERDLALKKVWGDEHYLRGRSLNVYVSKLRHFLKDDPAIEILNVHGIGYRMVIRD